MVTTRVRVVVGGLYLKGLPGRGRGKTGSESLLKIVTIHRLLSIVESQREKENFRDLVC